MKSFIINCLIIFILSQVLQQTNHYEEVCYLASLIVGGLCGIISCYNK